MKPKVTFIRTNAYHADARLVNLESAVTNDFACSFIVWNRDRQSEKRSNIRAFPFRVPFGKIIILLYLPAWFLFSFWQLLLLRPDIIHACDLEGMVPVYLYTRFRTVPVVYDVWDAMIGRMPVRQPQLRAMMIRTERWLMRRADHITAPDKERLDQLEATAPEFSSKFTTIYNSQVLPKRSTPVVVHLPSHLSLAYVGVMSRQIRGIEFMRALAPHFPTVDFHIAGYGPDGPYFDELFKKTQTKNIHYYGRVSRNEATQINQNADVIISLLDPQYENYRYATSTKIFEAFSLCKPVITSKGTASASLVKTAQWGFIIDFDQQSLSDLITKLTSSETTITLDPTLCAPYDWNRVSKTLVNIYRSLLSLS